MGSPIFALAVERYHEARAEYGDYLEAAFTRAQDETAGAMLNARGRRAGIDPFSLFSGNETRALAYASEELIDHWRRFPRMSFSAFERQWQPSGGWS